MDQYEKAIREKVHLSNILSNGEWVYLVGLFHMARENEWLRIENERLRYEKRQEGLDHANDLRHASHQRYGQGSRGETQKAPGKNPTLPARGR